MFGAQTFILVFVKIRKLLNRRPHSSKVVLCVMLDRRKTSLLHHALRIKLLRLRINLNNSPCLFLTLILINSSKPLSWLKLRNTDEVIVLEYAQRLALSRWNCKTIIKSHLDFVILGSCKRASRFTLFVALRSSFDRWLKTSTKLRCIANDLWNRSLSVDVWALQIKDVFNRWILSVPVNLFVHLCTLKQRFVWSCVLRRSQISFLWFRLHDYLLIWFQ